MAFNKEKLDLHVTDMLAQVGAFKDEVCASVKLGDADTQMITTDAGNSIAVSVDADGAHEVEFRLSSSVSK